MRLVDFISELIHSFSCSFYIQLEMQLASQYVKIIIKSNYFYYILTRNIQHIRQLITNKSVDTHVMRQIVV